MAVLTDFTDKDESSELSHVIYDDEDVIYDDPRYTWDGYIAFQEETVPDTSFSKAAASPSTGFIDLRRETFIFDSNINRFMFNAILLNDNMLTRGLAESIFTDKSVPATNFTDV